MRLLDVWIFTFLLATPIGFLMHPAAGATLLGIMLLGPVIATVAAQDIENAKTLDRAAAHNANQNGHTA